MFSFLFLLPKLLDVLLNIGKHSNTNGPYGAFNFVVLEMPVCYLYRTKDKS